MATEIVGPFQERRLVVDGWSVPLINVVELDGGRFNFTLDHRLGLEVDAEHFDRVARFVADCISVGLGLPAHPRGEREELPADFFNGLHQALRPTHLLEIVRVRTDAEADPELEKNGD